MGCRMLAVGCMLWAVVELEDGSVRRGGVGVCWGGCAFCSCLSLGGASSVPLLSCGGSSVGFGLDLAVACGVWRTQALAFLRFV